MTAHSTMSALDTPAPMKKRITRRKWIVVLAAACVVLALAGTLFSRHEKQLQVQAVSPEFQDIESTVSATGEVIPVHDFQARTNFSGMVDGIYVHLGQKVHRGQMLVRMRDQFAPARIASASADLKSAEVNYENVENNGSQEDRIGFAAELVRAQAERNAAADALSSLQKLLQRGSVSEAEVEAGAQRLKAADAALQSLNERIHNRYSPADIASWKAKVSADRATIAAERVSYSNANISSPINGTVYIIPVTVYDFVPAGAELLHVADLSQLEVSAPFSEPDIGKLYQNQPVRITWDGNAGLTWSGHIVTRPLAVTRSGASGTGVCIIALDDVKDDLPVNSTVAATVVTGKHSHALTIPRAALYSRGGSYFVYRITGGHLVETPVEIGVLNAFRVEITRGLSIKDVLALRAADDEPLSNNRRVTTIQ